MIAACALSLEPKSQASGLDRSVMQALIFDQSRGEPWSFSVPGESFARVLPTLKIREARAVRLDRGKIHVGLAGLATEPQSVTALMFAPCPNIALAAHQIVQLVGRCEAASKPDPIYCGIAANHGSWDRPDTWFADAVRATVKKGNAPNFGMPNDAFLDAGDAVDTLPTRQLAALGKPVLTFHDRERGWSSALFPAKPMTTGHPATDMQHRGHAAEQSHSNGASPQARATNKSPGDGLFVPRSSEPK